MASWIPYKHFSTNISLSKDQAVQVLSQGIPPWDFKSAFRFWEKQDGYEGSVSKRGFTFRRKISGRDSFLPSGFGRFVVIENGTRIEIYIVAPTIVLFIPVILFFGLIGLAILVAAQLVGLLLVGFAILFFGLFVKEFAEEAPRAEDFIRQILSEYTTN